MLRAKRRGFTLIELLVVVVIIGILASIGVGAYNQAMDRSRNGGVISNVRAIQIGIEQWKTDHPGLPEELVGNDPNKHVAADGATNPDTFPVKYTSGGRLPPGPWSRPPQTAMDGAPFNASEGATSDSDTAMGASPAAEVIGDSGGAGGKIFSMSGGFFADGGSGTGGPPPAGEGPSKRTHYGYVYYLGETSSSRYAVLGVGKNKKNADVVAVKSNFQ